MTIHFLDRADTLLVDGRFSDSQLRPGLLAKLRCAERDAETLQLTRAEWSEITDVIIEYEIASNK